MGKYQVGDKVVLRKDLVDGAMYGGCYWVSAKCSLAAKDYVTIDFAIPCGGVYHADDWVISDEMIQGLYTEGETKMKYQVGDKVVLRNDLVDGAEYGKCIWVSAMNPLADKGYVTIKDVCHFDCYKTEEAYCYAISDEMIQGLYTGEEDRFLFRTEEVAGVSLFLRKGALLGEISHVADIEKLAESPDYLLTEEEAKQSPLYSSLIRVPLSEAVVPKYVLNKGDLYVGRLNSAKGPIVIGSDEELGGLDIVTEFTDTEVEDIQQAVADLTVNKA